MNLKELENMTVDSFSFVLFIFFILALIMLEKKKDPLERIDKKLELIIKNLY